MIFSRKLSFVVAAVLALVLPAHAEKAHVHGAGNLDVAIDRETITLMLELPMDVLVGFERAPRSEKEKAALHAAQKTLEDASALFLSTPAAGCTAQSTTVTMPHFREQRPPAKGGESEGSHGDAAATYVFRCASAGALKSIETTLFQRFGRLYRLHTQRVGPTGQGATRLTPKDPVLRW